MKTIATLKATIEDLRAVEEMMAELKAEAEQLKDELKAELTERELQELEVDQYIVRYTDILSNRLDSTRLKKDLPDLYKNYTKQVASKRFSIS